MDTFPFDEYCARTGAGSTGIPIYDRLEELQRAQLYSIPYENFDIHLGRPIELSQQRLVDKLIRSKRGGYCFELNGLFLGALRAAGFEARPLLARVHLGGEPTGRGHQLSLISIGRREWIVDVGFAVGPRMPLLFEYDRESQHDNAVLRLHEHELGAMLQRREENGWLDLYSFDQSLVVPNDIEYGNHCTQTLPSTFNYANRIAIQCHPGGQIRLFNFRCTTLEKGEETVDEIPDDQRYLVALSERFGIELDAAYEELRPVPALALG